MERYSMFLGRKNQYCENDYTTKCNLQSQCNPYQITNGIFHRTRTKKFHNSYENTKYPEQPKPSGERRMELEESTFLTSDYTTKLQSSRQYGTGTKKKKQKTKKHKYRPMEQGRKPRNKPMHLWVPYF